ncbi:acetyl/propionyl/methylcrotonyl-CoA carboxylase subunit alpha [Microbacterium sp. JB110]|uniref:acetyl/propionyl/methylcrotonyl-CoA carboxylase subunit alpha n=3 Tax=unclassified Microbacterium TaxID=2609290 RepID=UPI00097EEB4C|nr:biotin carboxylase N-terminal domain-containing protein [Microbacterium sp. JB110]RCS63101.1 ATP-grasp domain-containing protein [Microbacterium sp. JB110]SJM59920.1 Methylcrotonyl-CoA carboxylase biotin-containing subunit [Frigoribacterium sp. JB110]
MFDRVLIANRGEIAVRIIRTLDRMGVASVAVHSDADADAMHVRAATVAVRIGPADPRRSYLDIDAIVRAARATESEAVHPGYGFLAESAAFARACRDAGLVFIGPPAEAIETMGDKIRARSAVEARGIATVPGISEPDLDDAALIAGAARTGYPVLVKPSQGGGGKGMHRVDEPAALPDALARARREAAGAFGDDTLFVERFVANPRHIEVQVLADRGGAVIHLGERECSLQRRHQKVIEEAPSPLLTPQQREEIGHAACETARAVGYVGAGTVEFIVSGDDPGEPFFMEMNTRLQVEHPVTEAVTGIDLVEQQLRVAAGEPLAIEQRDVSITGHAVEARIYAEDPAHDFAPAGGEVLEVSWPEGEGIRVDAGVQTGDTVSSHYDPMIAKVIAHAPTRADAIERLDQALAGTRVLGVTTNTAFLQALIAEPAVRAGDLDTGLIDREVERLARRDVPDAVLAQAGLALIERAAGGVRAWQSDGWRVGGPVGASVRLRDEDSIAIVTRFGTVTPTGGDRVGRGARRVEVRVARERGHSMIRELEHPAGLRATPDGDVWLADSSGVWLVEQARPAARRSGGSAPTLASPMPGAVVAVHVTDGDEVVQGAAIVSVEAMKMEHVLRAPSAGVVHVATTVGEQVARGQELATVTPVAPAAEEER